MEDKVTPTPPEIPQDLQNQVSAIRAIATAFNVLDKGMFPVSYLKAVEASQSFLRALHEQSLQTALQHPDADKVPELQQLKSKEA